MEFDIEIPGTKDFIFAVDYSYYTGDTKRHILNILMCILVDDVRYTYNFDADSLIVTDDKSYFRYMDISNKTYMNDVKKFKSYIESAFSHILKDVIEKEMLNTMRANTKKEDDKNTTNNITVHKDYDNISFNDIMNMCNSIYKSKVSMKAFSYYDNGREHNFIIIDNAHNNKCEIKINYTKGKCTSIIIRSMEHKRASYIISFKELSVITEYGDCGYFKLSDKIIDSSEINDDNSYTDTYFVQMVEAIVDEYYKIEYDDNSNKKIFNVFISQPMNGLSLDEIEAKRAILITKFKKYVNKKDPGTLYKLDILNNLQKDAPSDYTSLDYISNDIKTIKDADIILFANGFNDARGCLVEDLVWYSYKRNPKDFVNETRRTNYEFIKKKFTTNKFIESDIDNYLECKSDD